MPKFLIERELPGAGELTEGDMESMLSRSSHVLHELGPEIQWLHSYITGSKLYCIFLAPNEAILYEHARRTGIPLDRIEQVKTGLYPKSAKREMESANTQASRAQRAPIKQASTATTTAAPAALENTSTTVAQAVIRSTAEG